MFPDHKPIWRQQPELVISPTWTSCVMIVAGIYLGYWWAWAIGVSLLITVAILLILDCVVTRRGNRLRAELREMLKDSNGTL